MHPATAAPERARPQGAGPIGAGRRGNGLPNSGAKRAGAADHRCSLPFRGFAFSELREGADSGRRARPIGRGEPIGPLRFCNPQG